MSARAITGMLLASGLFATSLLPSCTEPSGDVPAMVFASASLTAPFEELATAFAASHPGKSIELHCAGTPRLVLQLRAGAPADVFASADTVQMQRVVDAGQVTARPTPFAGNRLTIITSRDNPKGIDELADLARPDVTVLLCGPEVPAGRYARSALRKANVDVESLSDEPSVRAVVSKVRLGQVDAGIVYVTDAARASEHLQAVAIPEPHNILATCSIATLSTGRQPASAHAFVAFVRSKAGQRILAAHGFSTP